MRNLNNTPMSKNQLLILKELNDFKNWEPPKCGKLRELTSIRHNKSIISAIKSLQKRGLYPVNPFLPKLYNHKSNDQ